MMQGELPDVVVEAVGRGGWHWIGPVIGDTSTAAGSMQHTVCWIRLASFPLRRRGRLNCRQRP